MHACREDAQSVQKRISEADSLSGGGQPGMHCSSTVHLGGMAESQIEPMSLGSKAFFEEFVQGSFY